MAKRCPSTLRSGENQTLRNGVCRAPTVSQRRDRSRRLEARLRKGAIVIPFDWKTEIPGVFARAGRSITAS